MEAAFANVDEILQRAGMTARNIVLLRSYTTDVDAFPENDDVSADRITPAGNMPPQSLLGVAQLALPELLVEIEIEAAASPTRRNVCSASGPFTAVMRTRSG